MDEEKRKEQGQREAGPAWGCGGAVHGMSLSGGVNVGDLPEPVLLQPSPPSMPAPPECVGTPDTAKLRGETEVPLAEHIEQRLDPATAGWARGEPSGQGEIRGWFRFLDDRAVQPADLYFVLDCFPPVAFDLGLMGWAPTLAS